MFSRRFTAVAAVVVIGCSSAQAQSASRVSFSRVTTEPGLGRLDFVLAVADLNGDGRDDIVAGGREEFSFDGPREDRFEKTTLHVFVGEENGSLTPVPELVEGAIEARSAIVVAADFNGDTRADLAIFDEGIYVGEESSGYGNPPQLFLSSPDGRLRPSDALADAVAREHELRPRPHYSGPADLHLKSATAGDIDGDGDIDLWVDSIGGANVSSHFMVNNGDGTFTGRRGARAGCAAPQPAGILVSPGRAPCGPGQRRGPRPRARAEPRHLPEHRQPVQRRSDQRRRRKLPGTHRVAASGVQRRLHVGQGAGAFRRQRRRIPGPAGGAHAQRRWSAGRDSVDGSPYSSTHQPGDALPRAPSPGTDVVWRRDIHLDG